MSQYLLLPLNLQVCIRYRNKYLYKKMFKFLAAAVMIIGNTKLTSFLQISQYSFVPLNLQVSYRYRNKYLYKTRTKTSIIYAKENERVKERERKKGRRRVREREGEIREREREM